MTHADPVRESDAVDADADARSPADAFRYVHSANFPDLLTALGVSLFVTTYQAGKLLVFRAMGGRLSLLMRTFDQAMGLAVDSARMAIGTRYQIWTLRNAPDIAAQLETRGEYDACYVPRASHVTGDVRIHELAWVGGDLWFVNTRFSCLCTMDANFSFVPRWRPPFVTALAAEDRCHLNGLCVANGQPKYVTVLGETDSPEGWRPDKAVGGCLIDVASGEVVGRGLCMPHSPRFHDGKVWLLNSGTGHIVVMDTASGQIGPVAQLPGYARGLAMRRGFAFIGLSRIRETMTFGGLPIATQGGELCCGVWVVEMETGRVAAFLKFEAGVDEVFDVQVLPGILHPAVIGLQKETIRDTFVLPRDFCPHGPQRTSATGR
jgi:uncharacterized protein (TIGR03032 family)